MTRRLLALPAFLLCAATAAAIPPPPPADLSVEASFDRSPVEVGTKAALRFTITNEGPYDGYPMKATVKAVGALLLPAGVDGFVCAPRAGGVAECAGERRLRAGESLTIEMPLIARPGGQATAEVQADHAASSADSNQSNNHVAVSAALAPAMRQTDLAIHAGADPASALTFGPHIRTFTIENEGSRIVRDVVIYADVTPALTAASASDEWRCTTGTIIACVYSRPIGAGRTAELPLELRPPFPGAYDGAVVVASSGGEEPDVADNSVAFRATFGVASDFEPVLVPYLADSAPGAFGTVWTNRLAVHSTRTGIPLHAGPCSRRIELATMTDLWPASGCSDQPHGALLYLPKANLEAVTFSSHLYERGRLTGQLPVVFGSDFESTVYLPRVGLATSGVMARWTIRVYSIDAQPGDVVYADTQPPHYTFFPIPDRPLQRTFTRVSEERDERGLPLFPAYAEFRHEDVVGLLAKDAGPVTLRLFSQRPIWAMLVIVDNETQRPVFLTPQ